MYDVTVRILMFAPSVCRVIVGVAADAVKNDSPVVKVAARSIIK